MEKNILMLILILHAMSETLSEVVPCDALGYLHFHCSDGETCINRATSFCNGVPDCPDGSDEYIFNSSLAPDRGMSCSSKHVQSLSCHLPERYKCDHNLDCQGGYDECGCGHSFQCADGGCALKVKFCDGVPDCRDGSDEAIYNRTSKIGFQCPVSQFHERHNCILPQEHICDGSSDCDNGIDECFCDFSTGKGVYQDQGIENGKCFRCFDKTLIIPTKYVCDEIIDCPDISEECICLNQKNYGPPDICNSVCYGKGCSCTGDLQCKPKSAPSGSDESVCIPPSKICDMTNDCENGIDEQFCLESQNHFQCEDKKKWIMKSSVCNGNIDCEDSSDEAFCKERNNYYCYYYRSIFRNVTDWENTTQTDDDPYVSIPSNIKLDRGYPLHANKCDGVPECADLDDECYAPGCEEPRPGFCKFVHHLGIGFMCKNSGSIIPGIEVCDGKPSCNDTHPHLSDDELFCPNRFYCENRGATRLPIHISNSQHCDGIQDCDDQSDEMGCPETSHFYCNDTGLTKFIKSEEKCDDVKDCASGVDECQNCHPSPFSNDERLIKSRVLIGFLWLIGLIAVMGNLLVIIHQLKTYIERRRRGKQRSIVGEINGFLVLNLCLADILLGIYLLTLAIKDATTFQYCEADLDWRTSIPCASLGSIALVGCEAAIFLVSIMAAYRTFVVMRPLTFGKPLVVKTCAALAWLVSLLIALIPHCPATRDYFVSCVRFSFGLIWHSEIEQIIREYYVRGVGTSILRDGRIEASWEALFAVLQEVNSSVIPEKYFGYYSNHSVCLPRLFPDPKLDYSWAYSLFLMVLNLATLLFIAICYIQVYRISTRTTLAHKIQAKDRSALLQRKITRIVLTNTCCWLPVCVMALVKVSGGYVSDDAYAVTATILLPLNAALNPFLYSDVLDWIWNSVKSKVGSCIKSTAGEELSGRKTSGTDFEEPGGRAFPKNGTLESRL